MSLLSFNSILHSNPQQDIVEFIMCRHGETYYNAMDGQPIQGSINDEKASLSPKGQTQAKQTAESIAKSGLVFKRIISSGLNRAIETAKPIAEKLKKEFEIEPGVNAASWGVCEGKPRKHRSETFFTDNTGNYRGTRENGQLVDWKEMTTEQRWQFQHITDSETVWGVALRMKDTFEKVAKNLNTGDKVLVVTHQENLKVFKLFCMKDEVESLRKAQKFPEIEAVESTAFANCSLYRVIYNRSTGQFSFEGEISKN